MRAAVRQALKQAVDAHKRAQIALAHGQTATCASCGCYRELRTVGCRRCNDRHYKWARRTDPAYRAKELERQRKRMADRVAKQKARRRSVSLQSRPAGSSLSGYQPSESPVGRRPPPVKSVSAGNRHREDERAA